MSNLLTPLAKVRGLGSAKDGTEHFWVQRLTGVALVPLVIWFCFSLAAMPQADYATVVAWLDNPLNAVLLGCAIFAAFYHLQLGLQVILEDYISAKDVRLFAIILSKLFCFFFAALGIFSILKVSIGS